MIQAKGCSKGKRLVPVCGASRWKKDLFFHADVAKKPGAELKECGSVDAAGISRGKVKELLETSVILGEVGIDKPGHEDIVRQVFSWESIQRELIPSWTSVPD